jgi:hypothetical protein
MGTQESLGEALTRAFPEQDGKIAMTVCGILAIPPYPPVPSISTDCAAQR